MIRQAFNVKHYWKVIVYHVVDYNLFDYIRSDLYNINYSTKNINRVYNNMSKHKAKAVTISNLNLHISIVLINKHKSKLDYINSLVHEAEHIKQAMLKAYNVYDYGEPPAYTIGYLVMKMIPLMKYI